MAKAKTEREGGGGSSLIWLQGLACGGMAALVPVAAMQVALLLAPGLAALALDPRAGKPIARAMLLFGLAASIDPIRSAWLGDGGPTLDRVLDMTALLLAWTAQAAGWLLAQIVPVLVGLVVDATHRARAAELRSLRESLVRSWGLDEDRDAA
jgi:hypothetical protein